MDSVTTTPSPSRGLFWAGWILSAAPILFMGVGAVVTLIKPAAMEEGLTKLGYPSSVGRTLLLIEIACVILYAVPQTAALGAILLTGYLGGATASHVRIGDPMWLFPVIFGVVVWLGLYLRDARIRNLVPLRR